MLNGMDLRMYRIGTKHSIRFLSSSVGIVCMVDPIADAATGSNNHTSVAVQRNIPASCQQHTAQQTRSVNQLAFFPMLRIVGLGFLARSSFIMAKTNTWYYSWFILLGLCINPDRIIHCS